MFSMDRNHRGGRGRRHRGPATFGPEGPAGPGGPFGPGHPLDFDPGAPPRRGGRGRRGRERGDVRVAVLTLLGEGPMHGYQLMRTVEERTGGAWKPSPGAIYPTLSQLEDEGLVRVTSDGGRKLAMLTEAGQAYLQERESQWPDPFAAAHAEGPDLRELVGQLADAARQVGRSGDAGQREAAAAVLKAARRDLYLVLAGQEQA